MHSIESITAHKLTIFENYSNVLQKIHCFQAFFEQIFWSCCTLYHHFLEGFALRPVAELQRNCYISSKHFYLAIEDIFRVSCSFFSSEPRSKLATWWTLHFVDRRRFASNWNRSVIESTEIYYHILRGTAEESCLKLFERSKHGYQVVVDAFSSDDWSRWTKLN